jgi:hypothetical protein
MYVYDNSTVVMFVYLTHSYSFLAEKRKIELMDKYQKLGEKNVDRILEKRRKRNSTKDRKHLPFNRRSAE